MRYSEPHLIQTVKGKWSNILTDPELWFLITINGVLLYFYYSGTLDALTVVWIYYCQSVLIGIQYFIRMMSLHQFSTKNLKSNSRPVPETNAGKRSTAFFFLFHYGFFHFVYFIFLLVITAGADHISFDRNLVYTSVLGFIGNAIISLVSQIRQDRETVPNIGTMMFTPYLRIWPMHLFIIIGFVNDQFFSGLIPGLDVFVLFMILKTCSDLLFYIVTNKTWLQRRKPVFTEVF